MAMAHPRIENGSRKSLNGTRMSAGAPGACVKLSCFFILDTSSAQRASGISFPRPLPHAGAVEFVITFGCEHHALAAGADRTLVFSFLFFEGVVSALPLYEISLWDIDSSVGSGTVGPNPKPFIGVVWPFVPAVHIKPALYFLRAGRRSRAGGFALHLCCWALALVVLYCGEVKLIFNPAA